MLPPVRTAAEAVMGTVVVCEPRPFWAPALQREFTTEPYRVRGCPAPRDLDALLAKPANSIVVYDLAVDPAAGLAWMAGQRGQIRPMLIIGSDATVELEPVCRELGARSFLVDLISRSELAALCRRWLQRLAAL